MAEGVKKRIIVGASGASGFPALVECLKIIRDTNDYQAVLILSDSAKLTMNQELEASIEEVTALADTVCGIEEIGAGPASGTFRTEGMLVVPCSMKTLAGIHCGYADNLLLRAADVTIKEQRPLVLGVREAPLSAIHLKNMMELSMIPRVHVMPLMMTFYHRPKSIDEMVHHTAAKLLEPFGIETPEYHRWNGMK